MVTVKMLRGAIAVGFLADAQSAQAQVRAGVLGAAGATSDIHAETWVLVLGLFFLGGLLFTAFGAVAATALNARSSDDERVAFAIAAVPTAICGWLLLHYFELVTLAWIGVWLGILAVVIGIGALLFLLMRRALF